jgi:hypothetical protein
LRLLLITLTFMMMALGPKPGAFAPISGFDVFVGGIGGLLILLFLIQTLSTARRLSAMERIP